jgi:hypothetical protein
MTQCTCKGVKQINNRISLNMTFTFTIRISQRFSAAREFQMGNFQKYWSQNVGQDLIVLDFFHGPKILKVDGRDPRNREKNAPAGRFTCMFGYHTVVGRFFFMSLGIIPFPKIFLTVLFDTLTNNVSFCFYLFKCVALLCIYIIVIVLLLIYMWNFNSFHFFIWVTSGSFVLYIDRQKLFLKL